MRPEAHIERLATEVESSVNIFENLSSDLEDLQLMRRALRLYQKDYQQLDDDRLTWVEFESLAASLLSEAQAALGEEELPWPSDEAIAAFVSIVTKNRKDASAAWIEALESEAQNVGSMSAAEANQLHGRASSPPAILADAHAQRLNMVLKTIETRLDALKLDWLVERFSELPPLSQKQFLEIAAGIASGRTACRDEANGDLQ